MGIKLKQAGIHSFKIFEQKEAIGGTWRDNTYPGAECDAVSSLLLFLRTKSTLEKNVWRTK